jgi:hypothetical protein
VGATRKKKQFLKEHGISLNSERESFMYFKGGNVKKHLFYQPTGALEVGHND